MPTLKTDQLTAKQEHGIVALCNEPTIQKAAAAIDVHERTLHRWLENPIFMAAYRKARRECFSQAIGLAQKYTHYAVNTLLKVMADNTAPHSSKVSASSAMLKFGRESIELDDIVERVGVLEQTAGDAQKNKENPQRNRNGSSN